MDIQTDNESIEQLFLLAVLHNISTDDLVNKSLRTEAVKAENIERLTEMKETGGIPHDEMMDWLNDLTVGKAV